jgi:hypothetical protein
MIIAGWRSVWEIERHIITSTWSRSETFTPPAP